MKPLRLPLILSLLFFSTLIAQATLPPLTVPPPGGYDSGSNSILDPGCAPNTLNCWVNLPGGGSGWSLTGNSGTTAGTNFIGTTDAQDFMVKTNGNQIALFGQQGNVAIGSDNTGIDPLLTLPTASNVGSVAFQSGQATGVYSTAFGLGQASNDAATAFAGGHALGLGSMAWGLDTIGSILPPVASGETSTAWGNLGTIASGHTSTAFGSAVLARSRNEVAFGYETVDYTPLATNSDDIRDRLFSIGNGNAGPHNAYTLWKDGSFAYNDDNFQNDTPGTEQNMFYFNYGNHDGLGVAQTKRAIRLGSTINDEWDIGSSYVADGSIAIGFGGGSIVNGQNAISIGSNTASGSDSFAFGANAIASNTQTVAIGFGGVTASGEVSFAIGSAGTRATGFSSIAIGSGLPAVASGENSTAISGNASGDFAYSFGGSASGKNSFAIGGNANGEYSTTLGGGIASGNESVTIGRQSTEAYSYRETALGSLSTIYTPVSTSSWDLSDRLFIIGNGEDSGSESDALTILKNGQTGIAIDNFETNSNGNIFQVGDGSTGIIGYVDNGTGNWVAVSDERKKDNITDLTYGLHELMKLRPTSFNYKRNNEHTIGFLAQQVLPIIPEAVYGTESEGYGMSYATLTPVIVKAIQELNLKVDTLQLADGSTSLSVFDSLKNWFADTANGIGEFVAGTLRARNQVCIDDVCMNKDQLRAILDAQGGTVGTPIVNSSEILPNTEVLPNETNNPSVNNSEGLPDSTSTSIDPPLNNTGTATENSATTSSNI